MDADQSLKPSTLSTSVSHTWTGPVVALATAGLAFCLYGLTLAPGLTWANFGADGGELLAAAMSNGVPHPPGYPLYTMLLQFWLALWAILLPGSDIAWRGNLLSACAAASSVGLTVHLVYRFLATRTHGWLYAVLAGTLWSCAPLFWGQALITEVYAFHALLFTLLVWATTDPTPWTAQGRGLRLGLIIGLGVAHHLTLILLLPAVFYWLWQREDRLVWRGRFWLALVLAALPGLLLYLRIPWVAAQVPPVNWGYATDWGGFWWLVSGEAYRPYLAGTSATELLSRISQWAAVITSQFTPLGFAVAMAGLYAFDQSRPRWRTFCLLWITPVSLYTLAYDTVDSRIYLLPVIWLIALWIPEGTVLIGEQLSRWQVRSQPLLGGVLVAVLLLTAVRLPSTSLRTDSEAIRYLAELNDVLEPGSIVFSSADAETFTLWYGAYADGSLQSSAPGLVLVNAALYQFEWYRELLIDAYPALPGVDSRRIETILTESAAERPVFFTEIVYPAVQDHLVPVGSIWRYRVQP